MLQKLNFRIINKKAYFNYNTTQFLNNSVGFRSKTVVKTQNYAVKDKENDILKEAQIVKYLNENGAKTAPRLIKQGKTFSKKDYIILEKIKNKEGYLLSDLLFALLEQKAFGVWHGDIKPSNIFFNGSYVVLIDYDQAKIIPEIKDMTNIEFLNFIANDLTSKWSDYLEKNYYVYTKEQFVALFEPFLKNGSFNMGTTTIFGAQKTTHTDTGFYHAIKTDKVFIDGVRNLDARKPILERISDEFLQVHSRIKQVTKRIKLPG